MTTARIATLTETYRNDFAKVTRTQVSENRIYFLLKSDDREQWYNIAVRKADKSYFSTDTLQAMDPEKRLRLVAACVNKYATQHFSDNADGLFNLQEGSVLSIRRDGGTIDDETITHTQQVADDIFELLEMEASRSRRLSDEDSDALPTRAHRRRHRRERSESPLPHRVRDLSEELGDARAHIVRLEADIAILRAQYGQELAEMRGEYGAHIARLEAELRAATDTIRRLEADIAALREDNAELRAALVRKDALIDQLRAELGHSREQIARLEERVRRGDEAQGELQALRAVHADLQARLARAEESAHSLRERLDQQQAQYEARIAELRQAIERMHGDHSAELALLREQLADVTRREREQVAIIARLEAQHEANLAMIASLRQGGRAAEEQIEALRAENTALRERIATLTQEVSDLRGQVDTLQRRHEAELARLRATHEQALRDQMDALRAQHQAELARLRQEQDTAIARLREGEGSLRDQLEALQRENQDLRAQLATADRLGQDNVALRRALAASEHRLEALTAALRAQQAETAQLRQAVDEQEGELLALRAELQQDQEFSAEQARELEAQQALVARLQAQLEAALERAGDTEALRAEYARLAELVRAQEAEVHAARRRIAELEEQVAQGEAGSAEVARLRLLIANLRRVVDTFIPLYILREGAPATIPPGTFWNGHDGSEFLGRHRAGLSSRDPADVIRTLETMHREAIAYLTAQSSVAVRTHNPLNLLKGFRPLLLTVQAFAEAYPSLRDSLRPNAHFGRLHPPAGQGGKSLLMHMKWSLDFLAHAESGDGGNLGANFWNRLIGSRLPVMTASDHDEWFTVDL